MEIDKFAWVGHLMTFEDIYGFAPYSKIFKPIISKVPRPLIEKVCENIPPSKFIDFELVSKTEKRISGRGIFFPFTMRQMMMSYEELLIKKVTTACKLAQRSGAKLVTLGGAASMVGNEAVDIAKKLDIPITSAKNYIASLAVNGILKACEMLNIDTKNSSIAIIGATSSLGNVCARILADHFGHILLAEKFENRDRLNELVSSIGKARRTNIILKKYISDITKEADVILVPIFAPGIDFNIEELKPASVVCDAVAPFYIGRSVRSQRNDVLVFEAPWCKLPANSITKNRKFNTLQPGGVIYGCLGEGVILTMEGRFEDFSLGRKNITVEKTAEIWKMASNHGFQLPDLRCNRYIYTEEDISRFRGLRQISAQHKTAITI